MTQLRREAENCEPAEPVAVTLRHSGPFSGSHEVHLKVIMARPCSPAVNLLPSAPRSLARTSPPGDSEGPLGSTLGPLETMYKLLNEDCVN